MTMADRLILMRDGHIEQNGAPHELYNEPASDFTARFIGTPPMNIISWQDGAMLGVRPEHISVVERNGVPATVRSVEYLGADSIILCDVKGETVSVRQTGYCSLPGGTQVGLEWQDRHIHLFDRDSGKRRANRALT
jgi:sn-glycerol 3-phosphate transport system ATP-binding protein